MYNPPPLLKIAWTYCMRSFVNTRWQRLSRVAPRDRKQPMFPSFCTMMLVQGEYSDAILREGILNGK